MITDSVPAIGPRGKSVSVVWFALQFSQAGLFDCYQLLHSVLYSSGMNINLSALLLFMHQFPVEVLI